MSQKNCGNVNFWLRREFIGRGCPFGAGGWQKNHILQWFLEDSRSSGRLAKGFNELARGFIEIARSFNELAKAFRGCLQGFNACRWSFIDS
jgi:hypothetical protein